MSIKLNPEHKTKTIQNSNKNLLGLLKTRLFTSFHLFFTDLRAYQSSTVFFSTVRELMHVLTLFLTFYSTFVLNCFHICHLIASLYPPFPSLPRDYTSLSSVSPSNYSVWEYAMPNKKYFSSICHCSSRRLRFYVNKMNNITETHKLWWS